MINGYVINGALINGSASPLAKPMQANLALPSPLLVSPARFLMLHDFSNAVRGAAVYYAMEIDDTPPLRLPISSWQATLQVSRANFLQAVVPAVTNHAAQIIASTGKDFVIYRGAMLPNGSRAETEMARAPLSFRFERGPTNHTCTLSGWSESSFTAPGEDVHGPGPRILQEIRSQSVYNAGVRVRCAVDWFLRPGQRAIANGHEFVVSWINYYVSSRGAYMDVGETQQ